MTQSAVDLLIKSRPMWHNVEANNVPVSVTHNFAVLGRRNQKWESILSSTDDVHVARRTMEAANSAGIFDRIVITQGRSVNGAPAGTWQTIECALPQHRVVTGDSFNTLLHKLQNQTANLDVDQSKPSTPVVGEKHAYNGSLFIACILAGLNLSPPALVLVGWLCFFEILFLADKRPIRAERLRNVNTFRNWFYAVLNGALLVRVLFL